MTASNQARDEMVALHRLSSALLPAKKAIAIMLTGCLDDRVLGIKALKENTTGLSRSSFRPATCVSS